MMTTTITISNHIYFFRKFITSYKHRWEQQLQDQQHLSPSFQPDSILRKINDLSYVLHAYLTVRLSSRDQTESFFRSGLSRCNEYLSKKGFYVGSTSDRESGKLLNYQMDCYQYSAQDLQQDSFLCEIVLKKFQLLVRLLKMKLYKAILTTSSAGLAGYSSEVFFSQYIHRTLLELLQDHVRSGNIQVIHQFLLTIPQPFLIHRYDILSQILLTVDPDEYCHYLPLFSQEEVREGEFCWMSQGKMYRMDVVQNHALNWFDSECTLRILTDQVLID